MKDTAHQETAENAAAELSVRPLIIGVAGGTGSGKTTIARKLKESYPPHCVQVIAQDSYYKDQSHIPFEERHKTNYDHPDAYDNDLLIEQLDALCRGESVQQPIYSFIAHTRVAETKLVKPARVLIVEGILALEDARLYKAFKTRYFGTGQSAERCDRTVSEGCASHAHALHGTY